MSARITAACSNNKQVTKLIYGNVLKQSDTADVWRCVYAQESLRTSGLVCSSPRRARSEHAKLQPACDDGMKGGEL